MASLYEAGWRQGTIVLADLPLDAVELGPEGSPRRDHRDHGAWVVASQDCDLDQTDERIGDAIVELRPVYEHDPPQDWGIRSARLLLTDDVYVVSASRRTMVSPAVLSSLMASGLELRDIPPERRIAFITWLGLRYDRPAVPENLVPLARRIADEVQRKRNRTVARLVRDVLIQFDPAANPVRFSLFAVIESDGDEHRVREWLANIAQDIPVALGIADEIEAATSRRVSLHLIETSYAADVTMLTWRPNQPGPDGAI